MPQTMLAPCGIDCSMCEIRRAQSEPETMKSILNWFKDKRNLELKPEQIFCGGCPGDRSRHWSADCWILKCSVDDRRLTSCSDCGDFPCGRLEEWAKGNAGYGKALARLKEMKAKRES